MLPLVIIPMFATLGQDPQLRYTAKGTAVCNARVACSEGKDDARVTTWINVVAWGSMAEALGAAAKGDTITGHGKWTQRSYEKDGVTRIQDVVKLESLHVTAKKERLPAQGTPSSGVSPSHDDFDIPF